MSPRVFTDVPCAPGTRVTLDPADARHLALVLRMRPGDSITLASNRVAWQATLQEVKRGRVIAEILTPLEPAGELPVAITILQAIPKGTKMDEVVEKVTELGAARIVPIRCERSYGGDAATKVERWRRIAHAAAAQSQRLVVPAIEAPADLVPAIERVGAEAQVLVAWEQAARSSLESSLARVDPDAPIAIAIGPEGSFSDTEVEAARRLHCDLVSLGPTTLRTETAAPAAIAAIAALRKWW